MKLFNRITFKINTLVHRIANAIERLFEPIIGELSYIFKRQPKDPIAEHYLGKKDMWLDNTLFTDNTRNDFYAKMGSFTAASKAKTINPFLER